MHFRIDESWMLLIAFYFPDIWLCQKIGLSKIWSYMIMLPIIQWPFSLVHPDFGALTALTSFKPPIQRTLPWRYLREADVGFSCHRPLLNMQKASKDYGKSTIFDSNLNDFYRPCSIAVWNCGKHRVKTWYGFTVIHPAMGILKTGLKELPIRIDWWPSQCRKLIIVLNLPPKE